MMTGARLLTPSQLCSIWTYLDCLADVIACRAVARGWQRATHEPQFRAFAISLFRASWAGLRTLSRDLARARGLPQLAGLVLPELSQTSDLFGSILDVESNQLSMRLGSTPSRTSRTSRTSRPRTSHGRAREIKAKAKMKLRQNQLQSMACEEYEFEGCDGQGQEVHEADGSDGEDEDEDSRTQESYRTVSLRLHAFLRELGRRHREIHVHPNATHRALACATADSQANRSDAFRVNVPVPSTLAKEYLCPFCGAQVLPEAIYKHRRSYKDDDVTRGVVLGAACSAKCGFQVRLLPISEQDSIAREVSAFRVRMGDMISVQMSRARRSPLAEICSLSYRRAGKHGAAKISGQARGVSDRKKYEFAWSVDDTVELPGITYSSYLLLYMDPHGDGAGSLLTLVDDEGNQREDFGLPSEDPALSGRIMAALERGDEITLKVLRADFNDRESEEIMTEVKFH